jgi:hypothetical protein
LVEDSELGDSFVVPAAPDQALQVFHHPNASTPSLVVHATGG